MPDTHVRPVMVEFQRFGGQSGLIRSGERYLRTAGWDEPGCEIEMQLDHDQFLEHLHSLRYTEASTPEDVEQALAALSGFAAKLLPEPAPASPDETIQVDLVTAAAELWAFPFEASCRNGVPTFANGERRVVLTRRIRGEFAEHATSWPARPRVLFAHAPSARDLEPELIASHAAALSDALRAWTTGSLSDVLTVVTVYGVSDIVRARAAQPFTHIHILAHGQDIPDPKLPQRSRWGLRLGMPGVEADGPETLAGALAPQGGLPMVVTVSACDSGNQANPTIPTRSLAQELHLRGVPVVVASQLPLTKPGSTLVARHFYGPLLQGDDVRNALHEVRLRLHQSREARHDWLSLVSYVRLPEGYADHLKEVRLRMALAMLEAAAARAETLGHDDGDTGELQEVEQRVRDRIAALEVWLKDLTCDEGGLRQECEGLLASAHKRLAELLFRLAARGGPEALALRQVSRQALDTALGHYRAAFHSRLDRHWQGAQQLALQAALHGRIAADDWTTVLRVAEIKLELDPDGKEYWALGTIAEVHLLAPFAGRPRDLEPARKALRLFKERAPRDDDFPMRSTRRQIARYVKWWTKESGFFPGDGDVREDAEELLELLN